jgi:signal transduction histidine kinase
MSPPRLLRLDLASVAAVAVALALPGLFAAVPTSVSLWLAGLLLFATYVRSGTMDTLAPRVLRAALLAALLAAAAWCGGHSVSATALVAALAFCVGIILGEDSERGPRNAEQRARLSDAIEAAMHARWLQVEERSARSLAEVERLATDLEREASATDGRPLAGGAVARVEQAGLRLRDALRDSPADEAASPVAAPLPSFGAAHHIRRYWGPDIRDDLRSGALLFPLLVLPGAFFTGLHPAPPLVAFATALVIGLQAKRALERDDDRAVLRWCSLFVAVFLFATGLTVARSEGDASALYGAMLVFACVGHALNLRASSRKWPLLLPIALGSLAAGAFALGAEQLIAVAGASVIGVAGSLAAGVFAARDDARLDDEERLRALLSIETASEVSARTQARRASLLALLGRVHDASSPLIALSALRARVADTDTLPSSQSEDRARVLLDNLARNLRASRLPQPSALAVSDVQAVLVQALENLGQSSVEPGIVLDGGDARVSMRDVALRRVLENLVSNAANAVGGRPGAVHVRWHPTNQTRDRLRLEVHDAGPGLPGDQWPSPFISTRKGGAGLGALSARVLVEEAGGSVGVERSLMLGGACVWIELSCADSG